MKVKVMTCSDVTVNGHPPGRGEAEKEKDMVENSIVRPLICSVGVERKQI